MWCNGVFQNNKSDVQKMVLEVNCLEKLWKIDVKMVLMALEFSKCQHIIFVNILSSLTAPQKTNTLIP